MKPSTQASFDGGVRDSGIIGVLPDDQVLVTDGFQANYDGLIKRGYSNEFPSPLLPDQGLTPQAGTSFSIKDPQRPGQFKAYEALPGKHYFEIQADYVVKYLDMVDAFSNSIDITGSVPSTEASAPPATQKPATSGTKVVP